MMDDAGQISAEFLFLFGVLILIVTLSIVFVANEQELNIAMAAARNGVNEGIATIRLTSIAPRPPIRIQIGNPIIERLSGKSACPVIELPSLKRMSETTEEI